MAEPDFTVPPNPDADVPPKKAAASKRPTTRAGRAAQQAAKKAAGKPDKAPSGTSTRSRKSGLESRLQSSIGGLGIGFCAAGSMLGPAYTADGMLIIEHSENVARALSEAADNNPALKRTLEKLTAASAYGGLVAALLPLAVGIGANHGAVPAQLASQLGVNVPDQTALTTQQVPSPGAPGMPGNGVPTPADVFGNGAAV